MKNNFKQTKREEKRIVVSRSFFQNITAFMINERK
jgi:hypothetical protein